MPGLDVPRACDRRTRDPAWQGRKCVATTRSRTHDRAREQLARTGADRIAGACRTAPGPPASRPRRPANVHVHSVVGGPSIQRMRRVSLLLCIGFTPLVVAFTPAEAGPAPASPAACPGLSAGAQLIPGLAAGQALTSGDAVTLRFSNVAFACGSWLTEITSQGCHDDWAFSLTVPASAIQPGSYNLSAISAQFGEIYGIACPSRDQGCTSEPCSMSAKGIGSDAVTEPGAILEIDSVNAQCITGSIAGL